MPLNRPAIAVVVGLVVALAVITPLAWLIHTRDWGVALMLLVPFVVFGLIHLARRLAEWVGPGP